LPNTGFVGGTNGNFAELNRQPPEIEAMDGVAYPINPQVHASDERSLVEAVEAQQDTVRTARTFSGALPIHISSVTLKPPFNQAAREDEKPASQDELPPNVDPRQMSLFAAGWTVGSLCSLASGGAQSITYYETTGWRGLVENSFGSPLPGKFGSFPGMIFPVYWVFHFLANAKKASLVQITSDQPLHMNGLAIRHDQQTLLLISSFQPQKQEAIIRGIPGGQAVIRRLNEETAPLAAVDPAAFLATVKPLKIDSKVNRFFLQAYETMMIEIKHSTRKE
jgi:D-apionolactonase